LFASLLRQKREPKRAKNSTDIGSIKYITNPIQNILAIQKKKTCHQQNEAGIY
jgi:hypothetical protein